MLVYKDILTGAEMFSDSYKMELNEDGIYYRVFGKFTSESTDIDDNLIGGNASAEGGGEGVEAGVVSGLDIVLGSKLQQVLGMDRKQYMILYKGYCKKLVEYYQKENPDKVEDVKKSLVEFRAQVKNMWKDADDFQVYQGETSESEGMFALLGFDEKDTPYMIFLKNGLLQEKF